MFSRPGTRAGKCSRGDDAVDDDDDDDDDEEEEVSTRLLWNADYDDDRARSLESVL